MEKVSTVRINVEGGVAVLVSKPQNVRVVIRDYDVQESDAAVKKDEDGYEYREAVFE